MIPTKQQLEQAVADGLSQQEAAERFQCARQTVQRCRKKYAVRWPHRGAHKPSRFVELNGEWLSLAEVARRYGFDRDVICKRFHNGDRGAHLVRPLRHVTPPPKCYEVGLSRSDWQVVMAVAREHTPLTAARRFDIPLGAVTAALRGEEERLG